MKWSEMSARERDALVAERIMGQKIPRPLKFGTPIAPYSISIDAAWKVVEKLKETRYVHLWFDGDGWWFEVEVGEGALESVEAKAPNAPEAICLAALRAVGVEV
jgi:hypothetical protein